LRLGPWIFVGLAEAVESDSVLFISMEMH
jgi:hypothetical protein